MATAKRPRRAAGDAPAKTAPERNMPPAAPETSDAYNAPTLTMAAGDSAPAQPVTASAPEAPAPAAPEPEAAKPAVTKPVADGPTLIQPVAGPAHAVPQPNSPRTPAPARSSSVAARAATAQSLASERAAMTQKRTLIAGGAAVLVLVVGVLAYWLLSPKTPAAQVPLAAPTAEPAQPTAAPVVQVQPTAAPAAQAQPTAAPAAHVQPTAAPAAQVQPTAAATATCAEITGLPVFGGATCIEHDTDLDNGVTEIKNTYRTNTAAADVGNFYEDAFGSNGWTLREFAYSVELGARRLKVEVDVKQAASGPVTEVRLSERGAPASTSTTCTAIEGLAAYPNATCSDFDTDQENGLIEAQNTYTTSASPEDVRSFYENIFKQNGWAGQKFSYGLTQAQRELKVEIDSETAVDGTYTQIKASAK